MLNVVWQKVKCRKMKEYANLSVSAKRGENIPDIQTAFYHSVFYQECFNFGRVFNIKLKILSA